MDLLKLAGKIIKGYRIKRGENLDFFLDCELQELCNAADLIRKHFCGDKVDLCTIINGKSGRCGEDCKYCAQSAHHHTGCEAYGFMDTDSIVDAALANEAEAVDRFVIVESYVGIGNCILGYAKGEHLVAAPRKADYVIKS